MELASRVIKPETSEKMRYLMRFNGARQPAPMSLDCARRDPGAP
jgi:hypothetical protein